MIFTRKGKQGQHDNHLVNHISVLKTKPKLLQWRTGEQATEILITFIHSVKAAEDPEHQRRVIVGLDFEQCNSSCRSICCPNGPDSQLEIIYIQSSEAMLITSKAKTTTLLASKKSLCQRQCLKDNAIVQPAVFESTFGSSANAAHEIDWTY